MMFLFPKKSKFTTSFSGSRIVVKSIKKSYNIINKRGHISLVANECGKITNFQQEALRRFLRRFLKRKAQLFFNIYPYTPITKKPNDVRQGRGKGNIKYWAGTVKKGDTLLEIRSVNIKFAINILNAARVKLTVKTFVNNQQQRWIL